MGLTSLLPGIRELRTPLTAGYLWLLFLVTVSDDLREQITGFAGTLTNGLDLTPRLVQTAEVAAVTFLAYLIGAIWDGLAPIAGRFLYETGRRHLPWVRRREDGRRILSRPWFNSQSVSELLAMIRQDSRTQDEEQQPPWRVTAKPLDKQEERQLEALLDECTLIPTRLLGTEQEVWMSWDRIHAEAQFRLFVSVPLGFVGLSQIRDSPVVALALMTAGFALFGLGVVKEQRATGVLVQAIRTGRAGTFKALPNAPGTEPRADPTQA